MRLNAKRLPGNSSRKSNRRSAKSGKRTGGFFLGCNRSLKGQAERERKGFLKLLFFYLQLECDITLARLFQLTCANLLQERPRGFQTLGQAGGDAARIVRPITVACIAGELRN